MTRVHISALYQRYDRNIKTKDPRNLTVISRWGEWLLPAVTVVGLLVFVIVAMRRSLLQLTDYAVLVLLGLNVIALAFQVLKTSKRVRLRRSVVRIAECRCDDVKKGTAP